MSETIIGTLIFVAVLAVVIAGAWLKRLSRWEIIAIGIIGVFGSAIIPNIRHIQNFVVQAGENQSVSVQMREVQQDVATKAQQVQTDVVEIRQLKEQIEALVKRVEGGEQNVSTMRDNVRQAYQSLFEYFAYTVGTRNLHPPPPSIDKEIVRHINILAVFAYPDPQKRREEMQKVAEKVLAAQKERGAVR